MYIPSKLFVTGNAAATVNNLAAHRWLFRFGIAADLLCAVILIFLVLAFYRLLKEVVCFATILSALKIARFPAATAGVSASR